MTYDAICDLAAKHDVPVLNHTGSSPLRDLSAFGTDAEKSDCMRCCDPSRLEESIKSHPRTKFVLSYMGFDSTGIAS